MSEKDSVITRPQTLNALSPTGLRKLSLQGALRFQTGPYTVCLKTCEEHLLRSLQYHYPDTELLPLDTLCSFHVQIRRQRRLRRWIRPQVLFTIDGITPFEPYPLQHAFPLYEWGLNWCIGTTTYNRLMLHSAVVERNGRCLILPALPGSGKSTLCAGLIAHGWRLFSDEFGIVDFDSGELLPLPRAIPLKNRSIEVIREFSPTGCIGEQYDGTRKGSVAHFSPPSSSMARQQERARPAWIIFPHYEVGSTTRLQTQPLSTAFVRLANNSFNYHATLERGFNSLCRLIRTTKIYSLSYSDLHHAVATLSALADEVEP